MEALPVEHLVEFYCLEELFFEGRHPEEIASKLFGNECLISYNVAAEEL